MKPGADFLAYLSSRKSLSESRYAPDGRSVFWIEQTGRNQKLRQYESARRRHTIFASDALGGAMAYGGADYTLGGDSAFVICNGNEIHRVRRGRKTDSRVARLPHQSISACALSPDERYIAYAFSAKNTEGIAAIDLSVSPKNRKAHIILRDCDFFMQPRWHPSGRYLAIASWVRPYMSWQAAGLRLIEISFKKNNKIGCGDIRPICRSKRAAVGEYHFSADGKYLFYTSDRSGWMNLYRYDLKRRKSRQIVHKNFEIGEPLWTYGHKAFAVDVIKRKVMFAYNAGGRMFMAACDFDGRNLKNFDRLNRQFTYFDYLSFNHRKNTLLMFAESFDKPGRILEYNMRTSRFRQISSVAENKFKAPAAVKPKHIKIPLAGGSFIFGLLYKPSDRRKKPLPALILIHGGPTGQSQMRLSKAQYFLRSGYAVFEVNYRGSTGYGRRYRKALDGKWGKLDTSDVLAAAKYLRLQRWVDEKKIALLGASSAGMTALNALIAAPRLFCAGICLYGIADIVQLVRKTHNFERHYFDTLIGPLSKNRGDYRRRSPLAGYKSIAAPVCFLQGSADKVVPKVQTAMMYRALKRRVKGCECHFFENEGHGFKKPSNIRRQYRIITKFLNRHMPANP